ncbi:efflux RND transporter permease subunit [Aliivibrio fischeri]|uniref:Uncharacterized protein n=1 Tax=Aliivibrio fischeri TaxID=668 RepID=A0A844NZD0_ALIFS|nr:efflux RND transporter permease subunit [Aliivibrio fischeri]MUK49033.1 hypothetical protein [Aliivibrio fischeri]
MTFFIRGVGALLALTFTALAVRVLGGDIAGEFFSQIAWAILISTFISMGSNGLIMRESSKLRKVSFYLVFVFILRALKNTFLLSPLFIFLYLYFDVGIYIFLSSIFYSLSQMIYFYYISIGKVNLSYVFFMWVPNIYLSVIIVFFNKSNFMFQYFFSYTLVFCFFCLGIVYFLKPSNDDEKYKFSFENSRSYFIQDIIGQVFNSIFLVIASNFLTSLELSKLALYQKLSSVLNIIISIISLSTFKQSVDSIKENKGHAIDVCNKNAKLLIIFMVLYSVFLYLFWDKLMDIFSIYNMNYYLFLVLMISYLFVGYANSSTLILNTFGKENILRDFSLINFIISIISIFIFGCYLGLEGFIFSLAMSLIIQSLIQRKLLHKFFKKGT